MAVAGGAVQEFLRRTVRSVGEDRRLYGLAGGYILAVSVVLTALHRDVFRALTLYFDTWIVPGFDVLTFYVAARILWQAWAGRGEVDQPSALDRVGRVLGPKILANALLYVVFTIFFGAFTGLKCAFPLIQPFWFDPYLASWSLSLHRQIHLWSLLKTLFDRPWSNQLVFMLYYGAWPVILTYSPLLAAFLKDRRLRQRYLTAYLLAWIVFGTGLALIFMSAGPIFYQRITGDGQTFMAMHAYLQIHNMTWGPEFLWRVYQTGATEVGAGISDFPSMHVTMSVLATCLAWKMDRTAGALMTVFTVLIVMSSVYLGWHYALGDYVVAPLAWLLWRATALRPLRLTYPFQSVQTPSPA